MKKIILLALLTSSFLHAQTDEKTSKIKVYTPSGLQQQAAAADTYKWTVKTDIFSFIGGEFPIIGEYRIAKKISIEASAGVTYAFLPNEDLLGTNDDGDGLDSKAAMGSAFRAGFKFYPSSDYDAIEGWAFGIQLYTKTNNREYQMDEYSDYDPALEGQKDSKVKTGFALTISKQVYWDSNISVEYLLGIGFASVKHDYATQGDYISDENSNTGYYAINKQSTKETVPNLQIGLRLGFGN